MPTINNSYLLDTQLAQHRDRLIDLLAFARQKVPYYQNIIPSDIKGLVTSSGQWQRLQLLEKQQIQSNVPIFLSDPNTANDPAVEAVYTSGSTGTPLKVFRSRQEMRVQTKRLWGARKNWHSNIMDWKLIRLFRGAGESPHKKELQLSPNFLDISRNAISSYMNLVDEYQPDWMYSAPSSAFEWAQVYSSQSRKISSLKMIQVSGEQLFDEQRNLIERAFNCPVVNQYGCHEFWILSYECPERTMHAWGDDLLLETINDNVDAQSGKVGELVVTSLTNRIMPLIRYKLGDIVQMNVSNCKCPNTNFTLTPLGGRTSDIVITEQRVLSALFLNGIFFDFIRHHDQALLEFQVVQTDYGHFEIYIVPGKNFNREIVIDNISESIHLVLPEIQCKFIVCHSINRTSAGKKKGFVSLINKSKNNITS